MQPLQNSVETAPPSLAVPAQACDAHMHVFDRRFAFTGTTVENATAEDYWAVQRRLGAQRTVGVTPRIYGTDNRAELRLGKVEMWRCTCRSEHRCCCPFSVGGAL